MCSILELVFPLMLISGLVVFRHFVPVTSVDASGMLAKKGAMYAGIHWVGEEDGHWVTKGSDNNGPINDMVRNFFIFDNKTSHNSPDDPENYNVGYDIEGPMFLLPSQCIKRTSFLVPKKTSPLIAFIGNET